MNTPEQQRAIDSDSPAIICLAGPGAGKTATTVNRIKRLIESGTDPREIVALTFTNAAARELEERLGKFIGKDPDGEPIPNAVFPPIKEYRIGYVGTLHGFALRCLKKHGGLIGYGERIALIDEDASADLIASKAKQLGCKTNLKELMKIKGQEVPQRAKFQHTLEELVIVGYREELRESGLVDFDNLLTEFLRMLSFNADKVGAQIYCGEFTHLFVDEVQDSSETDWAIFDALPMIYKFFVGDPDQAIYSFRGGRVDCLMERVNCSARYEVIKLEENFRSHAEICQAANALISHNSGRIAKETKSVKGDGGRITVIPASITEGAEVAAVVNHIQSDCTTAIQSWPIVCSEIAVLARTNSIAAAFREGLAGCGIPVAEEARPDLPPDWKLAKALVELLVNPENDTLAYFYLMQRFISEGMDEKKSRETCDKKKRESAITGVSLNELVFGFRKYPIKAMMNHDVGSIMNREAITAESRFLVADLIKQLPPDADVLDLALAMNTTREGRKKPAVDGVEVTTMHNSKGKEWDVVFLVGIEDEIIPGQRKTDTPADIEESRRLFYVALTRARQTLFISSCQSRTTQWGAVIQHKPSRFVGEALASWEGAKKETRESL